MKGKEQSSAKTGQHAQKPKPQVEAGECSFTCDSEGAHLCILLVNRGDAPAFVVRKPRRLELDGTVLTLWFTDRGQDGAECPRQLQSPTTHALLPGEKKAIEIELPPRVPKLVEVAENGDLVLEGLDIAGATEVRAIICVADTPFYFNPNHTDMLQQVCKWGADIEVQVKRSAAAGNRKQSKPSKPQRG